MSGELGLTIKKVSGSRDLVKPYASYKTRVANDLSISTTDNQTFHICGDNDWGYLALDILKPILKEGNILYNEIMNGISINNPEVVLVGMNDFRILDILHIARDSEEGISVITGVPIVKGDFNDGVRYLGKKDAEMRLPF